ncbi:unnamed protein product [Miscanthus lutarioriparius]|uniref:Fatty acyl-CoA reductase n=1 Tax=Miscanthus lutarioriparius TaxID=422564 RepID=A0A811SKS8_9POAL|nr:unnamed protein product [Miscanthus lutarioriparius]
MAVADSAAHAALSVTDNASVLIEKILRMSPDIGKIYVVVKAKDTEAALKRLQNEVVDTELFKCLQEIHGKDYQSFVASKLVPVSGDIRESSVGIATELANKIAEEVDIIVNIAANTTFDERGKALYLGETISSRLGSSSDFSERKDAVLYIEAEIKLAFHCRKQPENSASFHKEMKDLGTQRAKLHGWENTYVFTKAMGEMVINAMRGQIPVVTMRPSIIESTLKDPFPGWIQGNRMMDPIIVYYGNGQMSCLLADPDCVVDVDGLHKWTNNKCIYGTKN